MTQWTTEVDLSTPPVSTLIVTKNIGFNPLSVGIDNYTAYWLYIQEAERYILPFWVGVVFPLQHAIGANLLVGNPMGLDQIKIPPTDTSYTVRATWTDQEQAYSPGSAAVGFVPQAPSINVGAVAISGPVTVSGSVSITGVVAVAGAVTITSGTVSVSGPVTVTGSVTIASGSVTVSGPVTVTGSVDIGTISGTVTITGTITNTVAVTVSNSITVTSVGGTVTVAGTINIGNTPAVTISGTPNVNIASGTVSISGSVTVGTITAGNVQITPGTFVVGGQGVTKIASTGTAVVLHSTIAVKVVMIKARTANVGTLYLGKSTVTNDETAGTGGLQLDPGDMVTFTDTDISHIYINGTVGDGASYMYWV